MDKNKVISKEKENLDFLFIELNREFKDNKEKMSKNKKILLFLFKKDNMKLKGNDLNKLWVDMGLNERSNSFNRNVVLRVFGVYNKDNDEKRKERIKCFNEYLSKYNLNMSNINYLKDNNRNKINMEW